MLTIRLESDSFYLHGAPEESAGTEIRGCLELRFEEDTRIKSITLQFTGQLRLNWDEAETSKGSRRRQCKIKKTIYQHDWTFLPERSWPRILKSNTTYLYPFDLVLPGHMAESISNSSGGYGSLVYGFKATAARPFVRKNLVVQRAVHVIRQPLLGDRLFGMDPMMEMINDNISNMMVTPYRNYKDMVDYRIRLNKAVYQRGEPIRLQLSFKPLIQGLRIKLVSCFLKEYTTLAYPDNDITSTNSSSASASSFQHNQQNRIISIARKDQFPCYGYEWKQSETLIIPRCAQTVQYDSYHPLIRIQHKIRITVCFVQPHGQVSELRVTMPINLLPPSFTTSTTTPVHTATTTAIDHNERMDSVDGLPRYEDACLLAPYDPQQQLWSTRLPTSPSMASLPSLVSTSYDDEETSAWSQQHQQQQGIITPEDQLLPANNGVSPPMSCDYFSYQPANPPIYIQHAFISPPI